MEGCRGLGRRLFIVYTSVLRYLVDTRASLHDTSKSGYRSILQLLPRVVVNFPPRSRLRLVFDSMSIWRKGREHVWPVELWRLAETPAQFWHVKRRLLSACGMWRGEVFRCIQYYSGLMHKPPLPLQSSVPSVSVINRITLHTTFQTRHSSQARTSTSPLC